jgi:hypothetical protein
MVVVLVVAVSCVRGGRVIKLWGRVFIKMAGFCFANVVGVVRATTDF